MLARYTGLHISKDKGIHFDTMRRRISEYVTTKKCDDRHVEQEAVLKELSSEMLQVLFYSNAPLIVRMQAGLRYVKDGGNGATRSDVRKMVADNPDEYQILIRIDLDYGVF